MSTPAPSVSLHVWASIAGPPATLCVRLRYDGARPPQALIAALEARGFIANGRSGRRMPLPDMDVVEDFARPGTGPFGAWTPAEAEQGRQYLGAICEGAGVPFAPSSEPPPGASR